MKKTLPLFLFFVVFLAGCQDRSEDPASRIERLGGQLRCPVCRGVPINESPASLAKEMMGILKEQVALGKNDEEILNYFEERYGEWVLLQPKPHGTNLLVWILPILFLLGGGFFIFYFIKKEKS